MRIAIAGVLLSLVTIVPAERVGGKHIVFLVDASGSMNYGKTQQALNAFLEVARQPTDDGELLAMKFDTKAYVDPVGWRKLPDAEGVGAAHAWLGKQAKGGTCIGKALGAALAQKKKGLTVVLVTDGELVGQGETKETVVADLKAAQKVRARNGLGIATVCVIGVGGQYADVLKAVGKAGGGGYYEWRPGG